MEKGNDQKWNQGSQRMGTSRSGTKTIWKITRTRKSHPGQNPPTIKKERKRGKGHAPEEYLETDSNKMLIESDVFHVLNYGMAKDLSVIRRSKTFPANKGYMEVEIEEPDGSNDEN